MRYVEKKDQILSELQNVLSVVQEREVEALIGYILSSEKVFVVGVGRVLLMLQAFVKRLNHLGIKAFYVGAIDEPAITEKDILIVGSGSGESIIPVSISKIAKKYSPKIVHIGSNNSSTVSQLADLVVRLPCKTKLSLPDEIPSSQPMSSLFEQSLLIFLDIMTALIVERQSIRLEDLWQVHANLE